MAYFGNSFAKLFLGTKASQSTIAGQQVAVDNGFLNYGDGVTATNSVSTVNLGPYTATQPYSLGLGTFGLFSADKYLSISAANLVGSPTCYGKPLILAATALYQRDAISPALGGYQESTKSKLINAKYVSAFYRVDPCTPQQNVVHVGVTPYTGESPVGTNCQQDFICNTTYYLRVDIKGSPALRFLSRNAYWVADVFTGCCPGAACATPAPCTIVDPTTVYIGWADQLVTSANTQSNFYQNNDGPSNPQPYTPATLTGYQGVRNNQIIGPFIKIVIFDTTGTAWYQPGTNNGIQEWNNYVPVAGVAGLKAGMSFTGAYVGTVFGDCTFYPTDFFEKEPVKIIVSETDWNGNPCATNLCIQTQCYPRQGMGFGDTVVKDFILSESYMQNYFNTNMDLRIREVTQGYDITRAIPRNSQYYRYFIKHNVPRYNNPTGMFDHDQYLLEIITTAPSPSFESGFSGWLACCGSGCAINLVDNSCVYTCINCASISPAFTVTGAATLSVSGGGGTYTANGGFAGTNPIISLTGYIPPGITVTQHTTGTATIKGTAGSGVGSTISVVAIDANNCQTAPLTVTLTT